MSVEMETVTDELEKEDDQYFAIKCKLKSILKQLDMLSLIINRVKALNMVKMESYFLFNQFILDQLSNNKIINFDYNTLEQCMLFVLNRYDKIRSKNNSVDEINKLLADTIDNKLKKKLLKTKQRIEQVERLKSTYTDIYSTLGKNYISEFANIKSINRPFEYISRQLMVNIKNHLSINFLKFQKIYIKQKYWETLTDLKLKKNIMYSILSCIQYYINNESDKIVIKSKHIKKLSTDILGKVLEIIRDTVKTEKKLIPEKIYENISIFNLTKNYTHVLQYYYDMIKYLETNNKQRFSLLPQLSMGYSNIKFDSRFISTVYDEWIENIQNELKMMNNVSLKQKNKLDFTEDDLAEIVQINMEKIKKKYNINYEPTKIGIKEFEKKYTEYYDRCFKFKEMFKVHDAYPISFTTNGYSVNVLFKRTISLPLPEQNKLPTESENNKNEISSKINLDEYQKDKKIKKGLFDADECTASNEFLNKFHKIAIDPNNDVLLYCVSETGQRIRITKGYYNEISHIRTNTKRMRKYIRQSNIKAVYEKLAESNYKKSVSIKNYNEYIKIWRNNWNIIWDFYGQNKVQALELDTYINKKKAIHTIIRKLIPKYGKSIKFNNYKNDHIDEDLLEQVKNLPILIAFGKGNGNMTISNLRNNSPKGPVKSLALELSKYCIVILVDEFRTSMLCSECHTQELEHPIVKTTSTRKFRDENGKKYKKKVDVERESHRLCYCNNNIHQSQQVTGVHKIWNRDYNAAKNILHVMINKLKNIRLGVYSRKKQLKKTEEDLIIDCSKEQCIANGSDTKQKVSQTPNKNSNKMEKIKAKTMTQNTEQKPNTETVTKQKLNANTLIQLITGKNNTKQKDEIIGTKQEIPVKRKYYKKHNVIVIQN